jgi:hypothetical protein
MHIETTIKGHYLRAGVVFGACLLVVAFFLPYIGLFLNLGLLFFVPQYLFPYENFIVRESGNSRAFSSHAVALTLTFLQWGLALVGFSWFARHLSIRRAILAAFAVIVIIGIITNAAFGLFGVQVELDGP